jgi:hypothetical protein
MTLIKSKFGVELHDENGVLVVRQGDEELVRTRVQTLANVVFDDATEEADPGRERRAKERAYYDMQRSRSDSFARRAASARKTGGKGGRGGV